ncbi:MAG: DUF2807 domain-containing protein [candidate division Zixibacteria bacterium]|nr:DUF2807 domain-containing protein [candidate division Zixibacteria bacterium]
MTQKMTQVVNSKQISASNRWRPFSRVMIILAVGALVCSGVDYARADWWDHLSFGGKRVRGSGHMVSEAMNLKDFDSIELLGAIDIYIKVEDKFDVELEADDNLIQYYDIYVDHGTLIIEMDDVSITSRNDTRLIVSMPDLVELSIRGAGDVFAQGINNDELRIDIKGAGDVEMIGETKELDVRIKGAGDLNLRELIAQDVWISIKGAGDATLTVKGNLDASIKGVGDITYYGNPENVSRSIHGIGDISRGRGR